MNGKSIFKELSIPVLTNDFEQWKSLMIIWFKYIGAWQLIENKVTLNSVKLIDENGSRVKEYQELALQVEYLLNLGTKGTNNIIIRESTTEDIFAAWDILNKNNKCSDEVNYSDSLGGYIKKGLIDKTSVYDYVKENLDDFYLLNTSIKIDTLTKIMSIIKDLDQLSSVPYIKKLIEEQIVNDLNEIKLRKNFIFL